MLYIWTEFTECCNGWDMPSLCACVVHKMSINVDFLRIIIQSYQSMAHLSEGTHQKSTRKVLTLENGARTYEYFCLWELIGRTCSEFGVFECYFSVLMYE